MLDLEGMDRDESSAILDTFFEYTEDPANMYEHVWRPGDFIMWDNLACLHARTDWPEEQRRALRRCQFVFVEYAYPEILAQLPE